MTTAIRRDRRRPRACSAPASRPSWSGLVDVLGEAAAVEDAVRAIVELEPDVVLLDVHMPGGGGSR